MKKLTCFIALLVLTFTSNSLFAQFSQAQLVKEWQRAKIYTKAYLDAMPADGYAFKPTPAIRSFAQQMLHLADGNYFFISTASGKANPYNGKSPEKTITPTKEEVTKTVMDSYDFVISNLQTMTPAQLQETASIEGHTVPKFEIFGKAFEHQTHHRGQTTIYLRLKGVTPPAEMLF